MSAGDDIRQVSMRPFARPGRRQWILIAILVAIIANGLFAWITQLHDGLGSAGYNDHAFWAIYIADVVTFIGVSYGGAVISAILRLTGAGWRAPLTRLAEGMAVVTVLIGGAFIIPHLGRPERIWELVTRPNLSSPIFWDFVAVATYTFGSIVFFALPLLPDMAILRRHASERLGWRRRIYASMSRGWTGSAAQRKVLQGSLTLIAIMIIPLAVSVHSVLSWAFSLVSRPWWHDSIWAPYFVVAALYSGVALVILVVAGFRRAYHLEEFITERHFVRLGYIMVTFAAGYLYLTFADILPDAYVGEPGPAAVFQALLVGQYAPWFWIFVVGAGVLPLLMVAVPRTRTVTGMVLAAAFVVPSMWLKRMVMVLDPATLDRITNTFGAYHFTWVSVSITLAGVAAIPLLLILLFRLFPVIAIDEVAQETEVPVMVAKPALYPRGVATETGRSSVGFAAALGLVSLLVVGVASITATPARAASSSGNTPPAARLQLQASDSAQGVDLTATLTSADRVPVAGATVNFYQTTYDFGPAGRLVLIGGAQTSDSGTAELTYRSTVGGDQKFTAKYQGEDATAAVTSNAAVVNVANPAPHYQTRAPKPLAAEGNVLLVVLLTIVAMVWLTLVFQIVRVRRACRGGVAETAVQTVPVPTPSSTRY